jgi:protein O-GlcNAc transferase
LRLGFVSVGFHRHPLGCLFVRALESLGSQDCTTICYSNHARQDELTVRLNAAAGLWRDIYELSDVALAEQIRSDQVDVLFDLDGHTGGNRLMAFARKPAPIQITWLAYVGTTGMTAMDYILADRFEIPPESERFYRESVLLLPDDYICFDPPTDAPPIASLPALGQGHVTFGSFNRASKITREVVRIWARILRSVPGSRLVLRYAGFDDRGTQTYFRELFAAEDIPGDNLDLFGGARHDEVLGYYSGIDIALDPFPYSGGLVTCESLWMGVPVITCPGETFAGRHSLSHLSNAGLTGMIARSLDEYVALAAAWAGDVPRLAKMRADLRRRVASSPLCDGKRFADNLMALLRGAWREWCSKTSEA